MSESKSKGRGSVSPVKAKIVSELADAIDKSPIVGVVNMENLPGRQLSDMRSQLRGRISLFMTKKRLIRLALEKSTKPDVKALDRYLSGMPALLLTDQNPFALYKLLKNKRSKAPIKPGQKAPMDLLINAGPTSFAPGPVIGELGSMKIKAGIEGGKVVIKEDKVVAKEGDIVDGKLSSLLLRLGIEPMEIGLSLVAVYEDGAILPASALDIDEEEYKKNIAAAFQESINLAVSACVFTKESIELLVVKADIETSSVAKEASFLTKDNASQILALADAQALSIQKDARLT